MACKCAELLAECRECCAAREAWEIRHRLKVMDRLCRLTAKAKEIVFSEPEDAFYLTDALKDYENLSPTPPKPEEDKCQDPGCTSPGHGNIPAPEKCLDEDDEYCRKCRDLHRPGSCRPSDEKGRGA